MFRIRTKKQNTKHSHYLRGTMEVLHASDTCGWLGRKYFPWRVHHSLLNLFIHSSYLSEWLYIMLSVVPLIVWGDGQYGRGLYLCPACSTQPWKIKTNICPLLYADVSVCVLDWVLSVCIEVHYNWPNFNDEGKCYKWVAISFNLTWGLWCSWFEWRCKLTELAKGPVLIPFMINDCKDICVSNLVAGIIALTSIFVSLICSIPTHHLWLLICFGNHWWVRVRVSI